MSDDRKTHNETTTIEACAGCMTSRETEAHGGEIISVTPWEPLPANACGCGQENCLVASGEIVTSNVVVKYANDEKTFTVDFHPEAGGRVYVNRLLH